MSKKILFHRKKAVIDKVKMKQAHENLTLEGMKLEAEKRCATLKSTLALAALFFYFGKPGGSRRKYNVGLLLTTTIKCSLMTLKPISNISMQVKEHYNYTVPTEILDIAEKDAF